MWVVFAAGLGLAQLVVHQRQNMPIVFEPRTRLGPLWIKLPKDWIANVSEDSNVGEVQVVDPEQTVGLAIEVKRVAGGQQGADDADQPGAGSQPIYFKGLGRSGVMEALRQRTATPEGFVYREILRATTELPLGYEVNVWLTQANGKMGAGERRLLEAVANEITWAGAPPARRPPLPQGPVQYY